MNSLHHVLISTLLVLQTYLVFQNQQLRTEMDGVKTLQRDSASVLAESLTPLSEKLETIDAVTTKLGGATDEESNKKISALQQRLDLHGILITVNQADQLRAEGKSGAAADKLKSVKEPIWQAGDTLKEQKARLQGLMQPIDTLVAAWQGNDTTTAPDTIRKELETVLGELGK
ncbi:hypothetical protein [Thiothrix nivea]|nr:hypothetical protein [Thiothrix nivea]